MMKNKLLNLAFALVALAAGFAAAPASATVAITPTAVLIEGRQRYADVTLINTSDLVDSYEMSWRHTRMTPGTGAYTESDTAPTPEFDLAQHLVFSPRRITLAPHASQKVRMALRLGGQLPPPGDYRTHFYLSQMASNPQNGGIEAETGTTNAVTIRVSISVPVIYRVGVSDATAKIGDVRPQANKKEGRIDLVVPVTKSESAFGILGELNVVYESADGSKRHIGGMSNAHIFREISQRDFVVPLGVNTLQGGQLRITYKEAGGDRVYDTKVVPVGK